MSPELEHIRREVEKLTRDWSEPDWHRGMAGKWTSGQILEHLRLSFTGTTKGVRRVMDAGRPLGGNPTLGDRMRTLVVVKFGIMPSGRESPGNLVPKDGVETESLRRFYDALVAMDSTLADAERRFGSGAKVLDHPFLGPLSTSDWRRFHRTHANHHLKQIARLGRQADSRPVDRQLSH